MIRHQAQPNSTTCVHTCWAMLSGWTVDQVIELAGTDDGLSWQAEYELANKIGMFFNICTMPQLFPDHYHVVTVPSLNIEGGTHRMILHWKLGERKIVVYDPNQGRENAKFYTAETLKSYTDVWIVLPEFSKAEV